MWILAVILAAICNAVMDRTENESFYTSVFRKKNKWFWYKRESWDKAKKIFSWKFDAWHIFKSLMLLFWTIAIILYGHSWRLQFGSEVINVLKDVALAGAAWIVFFNLFYNKILKG